MTGRSPSIVGVAEHDPRVSIQSALRGASNYNRWIVDQARGHIGRRVLDAGCGAGNLARLLLADAELVVGVDEWPEFVARAKHELGGTARFVAVQTDLTDASLPERLRAHDLDSAICSNVLEHLDDDVTALRTIGACLPPGSPVFVLVPAFMVLYGAHDRADHHRRRYSKQSLGELVAHASMSVERCYYMNAPGFIAWFVLGRVLRRQLTDSDAALYDRIVPAIRAIEERVRPPFGQSLVALLRTRK
jgi:SAM-dependent methyltransferase